MPTVRVKENEPFEAALRRFKRTVEKTGLLTELRAREYYEKPTTERKRKLAAAIKRHHKRCARSCCRRGCSEPRDQASSVRREGTNPRAFLFFSPLSHHPHSSRVTQGPHQR